MAEAAVLIYHVVGDLTVGKPQLTEFTETRSVADAISALRDSDECGLAVWKPRTNPHHNHNPNPNNNVLVLAPEHPDARQERFVGILDGLDIAAHLSSGSALADPESALKSAVGEILVPDNSLLRYVDPATRLIDALDLLKSGVRRLLMPRVAGRVTVSKKFSVLYNGKWLAGKPPDAATAAAGAGSSTAVSGDNSLCLLSREDVIRFLIGCLGALAPLPLSSISAAGAIRRDFVAVDLRAPAREALAAIGRDPTAVAVVEQIDGGGRVRVAGDISAFKLWRSDHVAAAWALANLTAGEFAAGVEEMVQSSPSMSSMLITSSPSSSPSSSSSDGAHSSAGIGRRVTKRFSTRSRDFVNLYFDGGAPAAAGPPAPALLQSRPSFRARNAPLTCRPGNSVAAVMAQMLAHRATHIWVTERAAGDSGANPGGAGDDDVDFLVGVVSYADIIAAVTRPSAAAAS